MEELEKAKLLSVATKLAQAQIQEVREELLEQLNSIQIPEAINGLDGRGITDARIFEGQLIFQLSDGVLVTAGSVMGEQGPVGLTGAQGEKGDKGEQGPTGDTGATGEIGLEGLRGVKGDKGDKGDTGQQGERGEQGEQGVPGQRGQRGERGEQGTSGVDGAAGRDGAKGETGERGPQGVSGGDGKNGKNGKDGKDGATGLTGDKGDKGDPGEKGDKGDPGSDAEVSKLEKKLSEFSEQVDKRLSKVAFNVAAKGGPAGSGEVKLYRLDDVDYSSVKLPTDGQALVWNVSIGKWAAGTVASGGGSSNQLVNGSYNVTLQANSALKLPSGVKLLSGYPGYGSYINNTASLAGEYVYLSSANGYAYIGVENQLPSIGTGSSLWFFNANGSITFPDNTVQTTAYTGSAAYLQVANANAKFATKAYAASNTYVKSTLANTNSYIATKASWSSLTGTNTAIRALATTKLAVANAFTKLTKFAANTSAVTTIASSVKLNDAITTNPDGLLAITLPDGSIVKIPYWN